MSLPVNRKLLGAAAASLAGLPVAAAAFLRLKYGPTVFADMVALRRGMARMKNVKSLYDMNVQIIDFFEAHAKATPDKEFVLYRDEAYTYGDLDAEANQLAHFVQRSPAAASKETVAIFMLNEPSFVVSWLAFAKLGLRMVLLNYNLRGDVLLHCIKACKVKAIACGNQRHLVEALEVIMPDLQALGITVWVVGKVMRQGGAEPGQSLPRGMDRVDVDALNELRDPIPRSVRDELPKDDDALYIFTSGTTGYPKPSKVPHRRQVLASFFQSPLDLTKDDVLYAVLPLYHSTGFLVGFCCAINTGCTMVLSDFSTKRFWDDVRKYRVTVIQYVGETFRYLLAQPRCLDDGKYSHKIRYAIGNGLASDIWEEFQKRFNISRIVEFYGATEGTYSLMNLDGKTGSVGRYHGIIKALIDVIVFVKCDLETAQPLRGPDGTCIQSPSGEAGLMLFRLSEPFIFYGYLADKSANEKKLVRNVQKKGDVFFNTGDLMLQDQDGYVYFRDRLGDTFRWKGENVATTEVAYVLNLYPGILESNVYGVKVPGHDGRAGMAAIVYKGDRPLDLKDLYDHVVRSLPPYACPKFLRLVTAIELTGTYKYKKTDLAREGFDPNIISDPLFFMDTEKKKYAGLDKEAMRKVVIGQARL